MNQLPQTGYLRLSQILGNPKANPPVPPIIPIGKSSWWEGVKNGRFPQPTKLGPRITVWRVEEIRQLINDGVRGG
ncbi:transcriptional regulator [Legionella qingyii]|uniref:AlpA family phage regulatory protein n=1 Tax=Legionella qingyii TaxID=2184757 RepID=A0A317U6R8_9GAMM|nr:AlpA family phage regulatory protein [Legionella qingyii]PWY56060.1 transcriptional regulator [Legionella qingyii]RUR22063.1 AlpA family phage regulatory protein [Legionella qingyii]RUR25643.1 AlpA family phage regulatory protein [Legionella qingyii]